MLSAQDVGDGADEDSKVKSKKGSSESAVSTALRCAYGVLQSRIISNPNDMMGILLFGTEATQFQSEGGGAGYEHCYLLLDLDVPDADGIRGLKKLIDGELFFLSPAMICGEHETGGGP
jgi:ATP-dependent DNA helicase 2 subunit 1